MVERLHDVVSTDKGLIGILRNGEKVPLSDPVPFVDIFQHYPRTKDEKKKSCAQLGEELIERVKSRHNRSNAYIQIGRDNFFLLNGKIVGHYVPYNLFIKRESDETRTIPNNSMIEIKFY